MTNDEKIEQFTTYTVENFIKKKKVFLKFKIIAIAQENIEGAAHLLCNLKDKEHSYILVIADNSSGYGNHLCYQKQLRNSRSVTFYVPLKTPKDLSFLHLEKFLKKKNVMVSFFYKSYSFRFIDCVKLMNDSLDSLVDNLTWNLYNR